MNSDIEQLQQMKLIFDVSSRTAVSAGTMLALHLRIQQQISELRTMQLTRVKLALSVLKALRCGCLGRPVQL